MKIICKKCGEEVEFRRISGGMGYYASDVDGKTLEIGPEDQCDSFKAWGYRVSCGCEGKEMFRFGSDANDLEDLKKIISEMKNDKENYEVIEN